MNFKTLLLSMTVMASAPVFAATYYVTPEGAGSKNGSDWDNAFGVAEFRTQAAVNANGDIYYFEGGLYNLSEGTVIFQTATGATLIGNAEGERTVFSGDKNGNNNPEDGDANRLIRFQANTANGNSANAIVVENIDFTCVYTYADNDNTNMGAFVTDNSGDVLVKNCRFYNNWAQGPRGGAAIYLYRSTVKFVDCMIYNNSANYRGGAVRVFSNDANKCVTTFENCIIKNNRNYHNLGGAIFMGHGNSLNIVNSTITGNQAVSDGGAIYYNGYASDHHRELRIVNSTIANNVTTQDGDAQIVSTQSAHLNIANSILTSDDNVAAIMFKGEEASDAFAFVSGGYNYVGRIIDAVEKDLAWDTTDRHGEACSFASIFDTNTLNSENVICPAYFFLGATGAQVTNAVAEWGLPGNLNLTVDQLGNERIGEKTPGAFAVGEKGVTTGIEETDLPHDVPSLVNLGGGRYAVEGVQGQAAVYNVNGAMVLSSDASDIDLAGLVGGLYMIQVEGMTYKVIVR